MLEFFTNNTLIAIFFVVALGTFFGTFKFGPIQFGAAGALFVGLAAGAFIAPDGAHLSLLQNLGLGLFVYLLGLEAGEEFFKSVKSQFGMMAMSIVSVLVGAATAVIAGGLLGIGREVSVGAFAGSLTSTPSLSLATAYTGSDAPAVGYSIGYPTGITVAIILSMLTIGKTWKAKRDQDDSAARELDGVRIRVTQDISFHDLNERFGTDYIVATIRRNGKSKVASPFFELRAGDEIFAVTNKSLEDDLVDAIGVRMSGRSWRQSVVTVQRFVLSNEDIAGNTIGNIPMYGNHRAKIIRVKRGDEILLATDDLYLASGDELEMVLPSVRYDAVESYVGNSVQAASELDWVATAVGLAAGFALAIVPIPLPGGSIFELGAAGGPLIVGLILGAVHRTGHLAWKLPMPANYAVRQLGLMLFLAAVGIASGPAFASSAFTMDGLLTVAVAALTALLGCGSLMLMLYFYGQSSPRTNGAVAGFLGQPAVLQYTMQNSSDSRIMTGYSATFAIALITKIIVVPFMLV
ncbi:antiporter [Corynebacterium incognita]|uniref:Antiporter n=1 Tax=Corynebacterium incognita TaxID=2754725 RepID=A0A7G7CNY2_9CORY|nr:antiporter [Corynebacterium incognita]QNE89298.1 antiporter [Corynebacterium incognita]